MSKRELLKTAATKAEALKKHEETQNFFREIQQAFHRLAKEDRVYPENAGVTLFIASTALAHYHKDLVNGKVSSTSSIRNYVYDKVKLYSESGMGA